MLLQDAKKIEIINEIIDISETLVSLEKKNVEENSRFVAVKGLCFFIEDYEERYNQIVGYIFRELNLRKNFSSDYVRKFIDGVVSDILKNGINVVKADPLIIDNFDVYFGDMIVYVPLEGIELNVEELKIGKVTLMKLNNTQLNDLANKLEHLLINNPYVKTDRKSHFDRIRGLFLKLEGKTLAKFRIFAEEDIAVDKAKKECDKVLDLLRFSSYFSHHRDRVSIGFEGDIIRGFYQLIVHRANFKAYSIPNQFKGSMDNFEINEALMEHMEDIGIFKLSKILEKSSQERTEFEDTLLLGLHWFSDSMTQKQLANQFLSLMICLEIFLTPHGDEPVSNSIAESAAIILLSELDKRKEFKRIIKGLYLKRSAIVHGRKNDIPNDEDLEKLQEIVGHLILWITDQKDNFEDKQQLLNHIENIRLT